MLVYATGWPFGHYTPVGGDDNHELPIGIGARLGIVMMFNVWGIIASRTNFFLFVPILLYLAASHCSFRKYHRTRKQAVGGRGATLKGAFLAPPGCLSS